MNSRVLLLAAATVVVVANFWVPLAARGNRAASSGGTLQLSERELRLQPKSGDSTVALLELRWRTGSDPDDRRPAWLDRAKLADLGFDCHVPLTAPEARQHYRRLGPRPVWLALTLVESAPDPPSSERQAPSRLTVVDAHRDPAALRRLFPNPATHAIVPGIVRPSFRDRSGEKGETVQEPQLHGWVGALLPEMLFVPRPFSAPLLAAGRSPSFTATVSWGAGHVPWLTDLRLR